MTGADQQHGGDSGSDPTGDGSTLWGQLRATLRRGFVRRAGGLFFATAASQCVSLVTFILVARLYVPESIGTYVVFSSCLTILAPVILLSNEFAVPKVPEGRELREIAGALALLGLVASSLVCLVAFGLRYPHAIALGVACLALATQRLVGQINVRLQRIAALAVAQLGSALLFLVLVVGMSSLGSGGRHLILAQVLTVATTATLQALDIFRLQGIAAFWRDLRPATLRKTIAANRRFALFVAPSQFFNLAAYHLPTVLIARVFGNPLAAQYGMGLRLAHAPIQLIGNALNTTYHGRLAQTVREGRHEQGHRDFLTLRRWLVAGGLLTAAALAVAAPTVFSLVLGPGWETAGGIVRLLAPLYGTILVLMPLGVAFLVLGREGTVFAGQAVYLAISLAAMGVAIASGNLMLGIGVFSALAMLRFLWLFTSINNLMRRWGKAQR